jgi:glycosyltransferase involved in cell wall biosynthesis
VLHGEYRQQPPAFQQEFIEKLEAAETNVTYAGFYEESHVDRLMQGVDVVVVPSIWWENSPVVIEEALRNRRPVICSDIGRMAEKSARRGGRPLKDTWPPIEACRDKQPRSAVICHPYDFPGKFFRSANSVRAASLRRFRLRQ